MRRQATKPHAWDILGKLFCHIWRDIANPDLADTNGVEPKEVESLANRLNEYDRILKEGNRLLGLESAFVQNNWLLLCFLPDDKTERAKMAKIAMRQAGKGAGKGDVNAWLADQEKDIKQRLGAESLQIR